MRRALALAEQGWGQTAPNPMVGAVVVQDGVVVGEGYHARYGEPHAEVEALRAAGERARGATIYVTLEPCNHFGKTPPCADALIAAGVSRVVAATRDPSPRRAAAPNGCARAGIDVDVRRRSATRRASSTRRSSTRSARRPALGDAQARALDRRRDRRRRPRRRRWLTGEERAPRGSSAARGHDAIAVGLGTVRADNPELTVRDVAAAACRSCARRLHARWANCRSRARSRAPRREVPTIVLAESVDLAHARRAHGARRRVVAGAHRIDEALRALRAARDPIVARGGRRGIAGALLGANLVDRLIIFQAPVLLGAGSLPGFENAPRWRRRARGGSRSCAGLELDDDLMTVYALRPV